MERQAVWVESIPTPGIRTYNLPEGAKIVRFAWDEGMQTFRFWYVFTAELDHEELVSGGGVRVQTITRLDPSRELVEVSVIGTGHMIDDDWDYQGTCQVDEFVWHLFTRLT